MESGVINVPDVSEFFKTMNPVHSGRHREYTENEKRIIIMAYEKGYNISETAEKLRTSPDTMRKFYRTYKRGK
jgi:transposase-like protein